MVRKISCLQRWWMFNSPRPLSLLQEAHLENTTAGHANGMVFVLRRVFFFDLIVFCKCLSRIDKHKLKRKATGMCILSPSNPMLADGVFHLFFSFCNYSEAYLLHLKKNGELKKKVYYVFHIGENFWQLYRPSVNWYHFIQAFSSKTLTMPNLHLCSP